MAENQSQSAGSNTANATSRVITIIATRGKKGLKIPFSGTTWGELKALLTRGGTDINGESYSSYDLRNMKAVESFRKTTLEVDEAVVPEGDFGLFLMPYKSKSGAGSKKPATKTATKKAAPKKAAAKAAPKKASKAAPKKAAVKSSEKKSTAAKVKSTPSYESVYAEVQQLSKEDQNRIYTSLTSSLFGESHKADDKDLLNDYDRIASKLPDVRV